MSEPAILDFGRTHIEQYPIKEYRDSLVRAFRDKKADFLILDDFMSGQKFRAACIAWAIDEGLLYNSQNDTDGQSIVSAFRLTAKGKKELE